MTLKVICRLKGGLGNQLFQYACAYSIAKKYSAQLTFDASLLTPHDGIGRHVEINKLIGARYITSEISEAPHTIGDLDNVELLHSAVDDLISKGATSILLDGYYQSESYFESDAKSIREELLLSRDSLLASKTLAIQGSHTVGIHIRRHDYQHLGHCADDYYLETIKWFQNKYSGNVSFYICTDEPLYVQNLIETSKIGISYTFINTGDGFSDFIWLSTCDDFIISNSTFSWWAAFLGEKQETIVFSPVNPWVIHIPELDPSPNRWCKVNGVVSKNSISCDVEHEVKWARFKSTYYLYGQAALEEGNSAAMQLNPKELFPCLDDEISSHPVDNHYIYHTAWAARKFLQYKVALNYDFGSRMMFSTIVSAFINIVFHDIRTPSLKLSGLLCQNADLTKLQYADNSLPSVSCMHTIEHIGLGRYGDDINPIGDMIAAKELTRVTAPGGLIFFVAPVGQTRLQFNAHRIYSYEQILDFFPSCQLMECSLIPDDASDVGMIDNPDPNLVNAQLHGCGCFIFRKI